MAILWIIIGLFTSFFLVIIYELYLFFFKKRKRIIDEPNDEEIAEEVIIKNLKEAGNNVLMATGNANPEFYGREKVKEAFKDCAKKVKLIEIVSGKIKNETKNPLYKLSDQNKNVNLYEIVGEKYLQPHFRIIDNKNVFLERDHSRGSKKRYYSYFPEDRFLAKRYRKIFFNFLSKAYKKPSLKEFKEKSISA